jgi:hypothetical protein
MKDYILYFLVGLNIGLLYLYINHKPEILFKEHTLDNNHLTDREFCPCSLNNK